MSKKIEEAFNECFERLLSGESLDSCLSSFPEYAAELDFMLRTAFDVKRKAFPVQPRPEFRYWSRIRMQGIQDADYKKPVSHKVSSFNVRRNLAISMAAILVFVLASSGTAAASSEAMPDQPLYEVKMAVEQVQLTFTPSETAKAELFANLAERRAEEIAVMASKGNTDKVLSTTTKMYYQLDQAEKLLANMETSIHESSDTASSMPASTALNLPAQSFTYTTPPTVSDTPVTPAPTTPVTQVAPVPTAPVTPVTPAVTTPVAPVMRVPTANVTPVTPVATANVTPVTPVTTENATPVTVVATENVTPVTLIATENVTPVMPVPTANATPVAPAFTKSVTPVAPTLTVPSATNKTLTTPSANITQYQQPKSESDSKSGQKLTRSITAANKAKMSVNASAAKTLTILQDALDKAPDSVKPSLNAIIERTKTTNARLNTQNINSSTGSNQVKTNSDNKTVQPWPIMPKSVIPQKVVPSDNATKNRPYNQYNPYYKGSIKNSNPNSDNKINTNNPTSFVPASMTGTRTAFNNTSDFTPGTFSQVITKPTTNAVTTPLSNVTTGSTVDQTDILK